jgi:hypothetical protein
MMILFPKDPRVNAGNGSGILNKLKSARIFKSMTVITRHSRIGYRYLRLLRFGLKPSRADVPPFYSIAASMI